MLGLGAPCIFSSYHESARRSEAQKLPDAHDDR